MSHTPSPWSLEPHDTLPNGYYISAPLNGGDIVCSMQGKYGIFNSPETTRANARLIAAAPDLQEQLARVLDQWHDHQIVGPTVYADARAALAKAQASLEVGK